MKTLLANLCLLLWQLLLPVAAAGAGDEIPPEFFNLSRARLQSTMDLHVNQTLFVRNASAAVFELKARHIESLIRQDPKLKDVLLQSQAAHVMMSQEPIDRERKPRPPPSPRPLTTVLGGPWQDVWTYGSYEPWHSALDIKTDRWNGELEFSIRSYPVTQLGVPPPRPNWQRVAAALAHGYRPPRDGRMTMYATPSISYSYGNSGFLQHTHTHAWIGLLADEHRPDGSSSRVIDNQITLWHMETDHQFVGSNANYGPMITLSANVKAENWYTVWFWISGGVDSDGGWAVSHATLSVGDTDVEIDLVPF
ncbi:hypothetical protein B0T16DRAFT_139535 [Cercophora newfieldiana]|uniref:Uncharacterized protein n=1 Tax=Cercophora newfieldiana TaxID=92897 RepID=A0AA39Y3I5_9PEZI|nr:hypothetical protein B0T16DRAFT_139535 [Cercophora newfieldiana]